MAGASLLAKAMPSYEVTLAEKNETPGGRARQFESNGFVFDMGPSWYWMPDIFERFYNLFDRTTADFYDLKRLDPSYQVFFEDGDVMQMPADFGELEGLFEKYEKGSARNLRKFLASAQYKYEVGIGEFVHKPSLSVFEFADVRLLREAFRIKLFSNISGEIQALFSNSKLIRLLEFPVLFLGAKPNRTPALYSLMNYADIKLGTWYPMGGMFGIVEGLTKIAEDSGVHIRCGCEIRELRVEGQEIREVVADGASWSSDAVLGAGDYHHIDTVLLEERHRSYTDRYWDNREMAPSALVVYLGLDKKIEGLTHHNLFFDADFERHSSEIYDRPVWPEEPLFYVCCPSKTDASVAPDKGENVFILVPLAPGLHDSVSKRNELLEVVLTRMEKRLGSSVRDHVVFKRTYSLNDFKSDYHSFKGNAYGLANTLMQTAFLKPKMKSRKIKNLYYAGQLTTPGPGMPPSLISGEVAARLMIKDLK